MSFELLKAEINECLIRANLEDTIDVLTYLLEFAESHLNNGWISIKDRLPNHGDYVLVYFDSYKHGDIMYSSWYSQEHGFIGNDKIHIDNSKITHWQPLPQPPKE